IGATAGTGFAVDIETVPVGNPGNAGELSGSGAGGYGPDRVCGAVGYAYNIGKYEVTASQYAAFLNAVAQTDTYGLYNTDMAQTDLGSGISRSGSSGSYTYSVDAAFVNRPVNYVSWGDAARFANWLHNGQPAGLQTLSTTEDGAYYLNGATTDAQLVAVNREADWNWAITSEDEWYKAAYHKNDGVTGNYYDYPTSSDTFPGRDLNDVSGNNANYYGSPFPIDSPYYTTVAGEFQNSDGPYGTFDQGGNVSEWNEAVITPYLWRGQRGGALSFYSIYLHAWGRDGQYPSREYFSLGFRVVQAAEADSDGDGVPDSEDQCPNTVPNAPVDVNGCPDPAIPADFDNDGDVDNDDYDAFEACASAPAVLLTPGCEAKDQDGDEDVDQADFSIFQRCMSGENVPVDLHCAD
ncbi:MAG: SUMF1/EgtB/PvdO family nonheme iron enzyme, partial [Phycisphaerae bacterium]|nr:SUMF1/EgtB/PvdO family nonheme iron enzyme [Phycisphaerae bacterium]